MRNAISPVPPATSSTAQGRARRRRLQPGDGGILPQPVQPGRHQVVHQVVAGGHLVEHLDRPGPAWPRPARRDSRRGVRAAASATVSVRWCAAATSVAVPVSVAIARGSLYESIEPLIAQAQAAPRCVPRCGMKRPDARTAGSRNRPPRPQGRRWRARGSRGSSFAAPISASAFPRASPRGSPAAWSVGLGRRAKYLSPISTTATRLIMHLGMSGSFRIEDGAEKTVPGVFHHPARQAGRARPCRVPSLRRTACRLQRSAPLRLHGSCRRAGGRVFAASRRPRHRAGRQRLRWCGAACALFAGKASAAQGGAARPAPHRRARQYLCRRGAAPRPPLAAPAGWQPRWRTRPDGSPARSAPCSARRSPPAARRCATIARANGELGYFQHAFRVYDREGEPCPTPGCGGIILRSVQSGRSTFHCLACQI